MTIAALAALMATGARYAGPMTSKKKQRLAKVYKNKGAGAVERRRRQMEGGTLKEENRGTVEVKP